MMNKIIGFLKNEVVLCVASGLAVVSMLVVPPDSGYAEYIDFRVLALLFCLMLIVAGFRSVGIFEKLIELMLKFVKDTRQLTLVLVAICFVLSMWITNDVALITFVPFAIMVFRQTGKTKYLPTVVALQTVAANLGSMCTPIGNPQNLYLYTISEMPIIDFVKLLLPYTIVSLLLLLGSCFAVKKEPICRISENYETADDFESVSNVRKTETVSSRKHAGGVKKMYAVKAAVYAVLFVLSILTVLRVLHYLVMLVIVAAVVAVVEPKLFKDADYLLLLTFVAFFIFVGNIKQIDMVNELLAGCVSENEILVSAAASQVISNVPAAVLLSGFTDNYAGLLVGTNIGGLGTLIASMASLISYKYIAKVSECSNGGYIKIFTIINAAFLVVLMGVAAII